jgi:hypothetical protein
VGYDTAVKAAIAILCFANSHLALAQGTFQNLDFESANIPPSTPIPSLVSITEALLGWSGELIDTSTTVATPQTQVVYDGISTGGPGISIIDDNSPGAKPIQGNYSVFLFGGGNNPLYSASISQTGLIPAGTESLLMSAWESPDASPIVAVNGQPVNMVPLQSFANYTLYGGNISSYAGQTATLSFTDPPPAIAAPSQFLLDDISFSPTAVIPEPNPIALAGIGSVLFALYRRITQHRKSPLLNS